MHLTILPILLLAVPLAEIAVFVLVGGQIGVLATLGAILATAILGTILLRIQGFAVLHRIRTENDAGRLAGREIGNGAMILVAGILLLTPGFVTDSIGFLLFVPAVRASIWKFLASRVSIYVRAQDDAAAGRTGPNSPKDRVIDLEESDFSVRENPDSPWRKDR